MKKLNNLSMRLFILVLLFANLSKAYSQASDSYVTAEEFQAELNAEFKDSEKSPLTSEDIEKFENLDFFAIDTAFVVSANFVRTPSEAPFAMPTTTDRAPIYVKYGELYFRIYNKDFKLNVYQNQELISDPEYFDYLFIPFTDNTNGVESYGGGRYLDFRIPSSNTVVLDFNKAYNPYCAYNGRYSCPIPPAENNLDIKISAGVKAYDKH